MLTQNATIDQILSATHGRPLAQHIRQPFWLKSLRDQANRAYVEHFVRPHFATAGHDLRVMYPRHLEVSGPSISAGDHVHFMALPDKPVRLAVFEGLGEIHIGSYSIVNPGVRVTSAAAIRVGESCMLAMDCYLSDADWHDLNHRIYAPGNHGPIVLEDNVWIGDGALVSKGVHIGANSIVGARAVVTKDVPANVVVAGNPAMVVKTLQSESRTVRKDLFTMEQSYDAFERDYYQQLLAGNSFARWLRSMIWPSRED